MSSSPDDLLDAFKRKNSRKFQECLEVYFADQNAICEVNTNRTVFETILSKPESSTFIEICLNHDADFYMVRRC
jgi:hypothetical protein